MKLKELEDKQREVSNALLDNGTVQCPRMNAGELSCITIEEERPLTATEKAAGWAQRPFWAYSDEHMCAGCAAFWHASRAEQLIYKVRMTQPQPAPA